MKEIKIQVYDDIAEWIDSENIDLCQLLTSLEQNKSDYEELINESKE